MVHRLAVEFAEREIERLRACAATVEARAKALAGAMLGRPAAYFEAKSAPLGIMQTLLAESLGVASRLVEQRRAEAAEPDEAA